MSEYPKPSLTVDIIVFNQDSMSVLLVQRKNEPFKDHWALPGGYFNSEDFNGVTADDSLLSAALRELEEETGVKLEGEDKQRVGFELIADAKDRDPRGRTISVVFSIVLDEEILKKQKIAANDDAGDLKWVYLGNFGEENLAFDHKPILGMFLNKVAREMEAVRRQEILRKQMEQQQKRKGPHDHLLIN